MQFLHKSEVFRNTPKSCQSFGLLLLEILLPKNFENCPIWSHWLEPKSWLIVPDHDFDGGEEEESSFEGEEADEADDFDGQEADDFEGQEADDFDGQDDFDDEDDYDVDEEAEEGYWWTQTLWTKKMIINKSDTCHVKFW